MGTWTIISPDGDSWDGNTPIECCGKAVRHRKRELTDQERVENLVHSLCEPVPYKKRKGIKVSAAGVLERVSRVCEGLPKDIYPRWEIPLREMLGHLQEMADRFYSSDDFMAVDEFLQLYALDKERLDADI